MKFLLQRQESPRYFKRGGHWVDDWVEALAFPNLATALLFCRDQHIEGVALILGADDPAYEILVLTIPKTQIGGS